MGIVTTENMLCDNCNVGTVSLPIPDAPLPSGWMRVQGYACISGGDSASINGYFCPTCVGAVSVKDLVKKSADLI